uniref:Uncharacterized protein n=1 Tax=Kalanchoe fedtschenkoi TaxID=63787 RepID=A0A7N0VM09_KALFE
MSLCFCLVKLKRTSTRYVEPVSIRWNNVSSDRTLIQVLTNSTLIELFPFPLPHQSKQTYQIKSV